MTHTIGSESGDSTPDRSTVAYEKVLGTVLSLLREG